MNTYPLKIDNGERRVPKRIRDIADDVPMGGALRVLGATEYLSYRQIRWWKGRLLPALEKDTGQTQKEWEDDLKIKVMPDKFPVRTTTFQGKSHEYLDSITILTTKEMT